MASALSSLRNAAEGNRSDQVTRSFVNDKFTKVKRQILDSSFHPKPYTSHSGESNESKYKYSIRILFNVASEPSRRHGHTIVRTAGRYEYYSS